jgi:ferric-dicitrate binding protein FerR (iron transport regulator)
MGAIERTFVLTNPERAAQAWGFVKANAKAMADAGKPLELTVSEHKKKRSGQQNRRHWAIVTQIAENAWTDGRQHSKEVWHEYLARKFGIMREMTLPDGEIVLSRVSTSDMDADEFNKMMGQIEAYAAQELGIELF